ncbi:MAG: glycosyltransferase family 4 protein [Anaerolineae bacterium]
MPLRIGLNAHLLALGETYRGAGINGYIYHLLRHLPRGEPTVAGLPAEFVAFLHDARFVAPPGLVVERSRWNTAGPWRRILWEQTRLAALARRLDLLHGLAYALPLACACRAVVTVHDLSFLRYPQAFRRLNRAYLSWITRAAVRKACRVIAVSESTRQDVIALYGVPADRVVVVPNGVAEAFRPADRSEVAAFRRRKGLPERFFLFLGTLEPRKNIERLLDAYALFLRDHAARMADRPCLVIAGAKGWFYEAIFARVQRLNLADRVFFPGFVPAAELPWWYRAADLFIYPSLYEGFGLPVLEAMACGTPVITSNASSLPEVAGDAALLVPPDDADALAGAMARVWHEPALAAALREAGLKQASRFSWQRTARETLAVYRAVLGEAL